MSILYLNDILKKVELTTELDLSKTVLIRHTLSNKECKKYYISGNMKEYTQIQKKSSFKNPDRYKYIITFISSRKTSAVLDKCYRVEGYQLESTNLIPREFINIDWFSKHGICFDLEEIDILKEYEKRLVIDWGKGTRSWKQWPLNNEKEILAIQSKQSIKFSGYENLILTYDQLKDIVEDNFTYSDWHTALSSIYAIYLIVDKEDGKQYVGSAYGEGGLLQRWSMYVNTKHGNNKKMKELICDYPDRYQNFQFSILQICPKSMTEDQVIHLESLYKDKLLTKIFGLNKN